MWGRYRKNNKLVEVSECINCGLDDLKHFVGGLCVSCYFHAYNKRPKRIEQNKTNHAKYYIKNRDKMLKKQKQWRENSKSK